MKNRTTIDRTTLPTALLPLAKEHARVRHARDDALLTSLVADAIDVVERRCSINVFAATYSLRLDACRQETASDGSGLTRYAFPVNNVNTATVSDGAAVDQSAAYTVEQADYGGAGEAWMVGPAISGTGWTAVVEVGMDDPDDLAPAVRVAILRLTAAFYEARESFVPVYEPDYLGDLGVIWRPTV